MIVPGLLDSLFYSDIEIPLTVEKEGKENIGGLELKLKPGMKIKLPYTHALELISKDEARVDVEAFKSSLNLKKLCWNEERSETLQPLEDGFYLKLMLYILFLKSEVSKGNVEYEAELKSARISFSDLLRLRLKKIVELAMASQQVEREKMKNMTREEQLLYVQLCNVISSWSDSMKKLVGVV
ncbi:MAG: hypothetical protein ABWK01_00285 [Infirmifilum sp.]